MVKIPLKQIDELRWEIPKKYNPKWMKVPARVIASKKLLAKMKRDRTLKQIANVAGLPGIHKYAVCLPDGHQGYGFPIGGVAAIDYENGCISPGGVGYDINCGVRLVRTDLTVDDVRPKIKSLADTLFKNIPSGLGSRGKIRVSKKELNEVLRLGAKWAVKNDYGWEEDIERLEENGQMETADPNLISNRAKSRGMPQLGSLGSGNHFLEIQKVDKIFNPEVAKVFGIEHEDQVCVTIHTGSRGFGHQVCSDYLREMERKHKDIVRKLPDRELIYAPAGSEMADRYFKAMSAAVNYAFCNRQMILHWTRQSFEQIFNKPAEDLEMHLVYGVAHNIAKNEVQRIDGEKRKLFVHRKGAVRSLPPDHELVPAKYKATGSPVLLPGCMGTASYVLVGTKSSKETFFSCPHGAGRVMSRTRAKKKWWGGTVKKRLWEEQKIYVKSASGATVAEESPGAYKDIDEIARVCEKSGTGKRILRLTPLGVVKG